MQALKIEHDAAASRFVARTPQGDCEAVYRLFNGVMALVHTEVPRALEGRGYAAKITAAALAHAREKGYKVRPACSYVASYMRRHPDTHDLLAT